MSGPQLGITLYSLTLEYRAGKYTFEELIRKAGKLGVGPPVEIVGYQSIRSFPHVSDEFAERFRALVAEAGVRPSCLGANVDAARRRDRLMTDDETVEFLTPQIDAAARLGFPVVRIQFGARPGALKKVVSVAEARGVKLGMEIHAPHSVDHPTVVALRELFEEIDSPYLGFIPDFGASASSIPAGAVAQQLRQGVPREMVDLIVDRWQGVRRGESDPFTARRDLMRQIEDRGGGNDALLFAWRAMTLWGQQAPERWAEIMPRVVHVHAKFFDLDENGNEPSIPYEQLAKVFKDAGYEGTMSSEWEGAPWAEVPDGFAMVVGHQAMLRRLFDAESR